MEESQSKNFILLRVRVLNKNEERVDPKIIGPFDFLEFKRTKFICTGVVLKSEVVEFNGMNHFTVPVEEGVTTRYNALGPTLEDMHAYLLGTNPTPSEMNYVTLDAHMSEEYISKVTNLVHLTSDCYQCCSCMFAAIVDSATSHKLLDRINWLHRRLYGECTMVDESTLRRGAPNRDTDLVDLLDRAVHKLKYQRRVDMDVRIARFLEMVPNQTGYVAMRMEPMETATQRAHMMGEMDNQANEARLLRLKGALNGK